jgi:serine phosphatase RsbU (regulator of sigma subunit)
MTIDTPGGGRPRGRADLLHFHRRRLNAATADARLEHVVLDIVRAARAEHPRLVVEQVFDALRAHVGDAIRRDDLTLLVARS